MNILSFSIIFSLIFISKCNYNEKDKIKEVSDKTEPLYFNIHFNGENTDLPKIRLNTSGANMIDLLLDTRTSYLAVVSSNCTNCNSANNIKISDNNSTFIRENIKTNITYNMSYLSGEKYLVNWGADSFKKLNASYVPTFIVTDDETPPYFPKFPGVIGIDRTSNEFFQALVTQKKIEKYTTTIDISGTSLWVGGIPSKIDVNNSNYYATIPLTNIPNNNNYWAVKVDAVFWGQNASNPENVQSTNGNIAVFDTTKDEICMPSAMKEAFENTFTNNCTKLGNRYYLCKEIPTFALVFGYNAYYFDRFNIASFFEQNLKIYTSSACVVGVQNSWVLGMPFFKQFTTTFMNDTNTVGLWTKTNRVDYYGSGGSKSTMIICIVVGIVVLLALCIGVYCCVKKRVSVAEEGAYEGLNKQQA